MSVNLIPIVAPLKNLQCGLSDICVTDIEDREIGEIVIDDDRDILPQSARYTGKAEFLSGTIGVGDALARLRGQSEVVPGAIVTFDGLGSGERAEWNFVPLNRAMTRLRMFLSNSMRRLELSI